MKINMNSINNKVKKYAGSSAGKNVVNETVDKAMRGETKLTFNNNMHTPEEAASMFIEVLEREINNSGLSPDAIAAVSGWSYSTPIKEGNQYKIIISHDGDDARPSLYPRGYPGGIDNIVALLDNGAKNGGQMNPVYGTWHGQKVRSRTVIPGALFIEAAVMDFLSSYAAEYNVINIDYNGLG